jgi:hypothetical protein
VFQIRVFVISTFKAAKLPEVEIWLQTKSKFSRNPDFSTSLRCARNDMNKRIDFAQSV